jgi:hypothetical protein
VRFFFEVRSNYIKMRVLDVTLCISVMFRGILLPLSSGLNSPHPFLDVKGFKMKAEPPLYTFGTLYPRTQCNILEDLNVQ